MSAKGEGATGRSPGVTRGGGRRLHQVARPRSNTWLWILNAIVIGFVVIAAFLASSGIGHTVAAASYHFMLYYVGVLALIALTAEVGIGLVCTDRIFMRPAGRVTMQAIHRATGFGAIAFLISHIILEIMAQRSTVLDSILPFLYPSGTKAFYLGLGTLASDMFIFIMVIGVYRARLATRMSPAAWRVLHASAYAAWIFGVVHGLLAGRPAKAFFGYQGFVYWSYGFCVAAVALALVVRFVAKDRARNELADQAVAEPPPGASLSSAAALSSMGMNGGGLPALTGAPHPAGALDGGRPGAVARGGRTQLALPAGQGSGSGRTGQFQATTRLGQTGGMGQPATARFGRTGAFDQFGADHPSGPLPQVDQFGQQFGPDHPSGPLPQVDQFGQQFGPDHPSGPLPQVGRPVRRPLEVPAGQRDWHAAYERPMGVRRPDTPAPRYEQTGEIDRSGAYQYQSAPPPGYGQPGLAPRDEHPGGAYQQQRPPEYDQRGPAPRDDRPAGRDRSGWSGPPPGYPADRAGQYDRSDDHREPSQGSGPYQRPDQYGPPAGQGQSGPPYARLDQYGPPAGPGQSGPYQRPAQYEPPMGYDMAPSASRPPAGPPPQADPRYGSGPYQPPPAGDGQPVSYGQPGQYQQPPAAAYDPRDQYTRPGAYDRAAQFERDRAEHYASFAEQDASYTRPRPPAARGYYDPQDETDPLNISAVNTGYRQ